MNPFKSMAEQFPDLFPANMLSAIQSSMAHIKIAEDEIAKAKGRYPAETHQKIWAAFRQLQPRAHALAAREKLYRAHCRELIHRVVRGEDLRPGTKAEALLVLIETSLVGPLNEPGFALYSKLFSDLFPDDAKRIAVDWGKFAGREQWPGQNDQQLLALRFKLAHHRWLDPKRKKKPQAKSAGVPPRPRSLRERYSDLAAALGLKQDGLRQ